MRNIGLGTLVTFEGPLGDQISGRVVGAPSDTERMIEYAGFRYPEQIIEHVDSLKVDLADLHKRYMATLWDAGIKREERQAFQESLGLPVSTKAFTLDHYETGIEKLVAPERDRYEEGCMNEDRDPIMYAIKRIGRRPFTYSDYRTLNASLWGERERE